MSRTVEARADRFALSRPFRISRGVRTAAEVVTVEISAGGHIGRGEGVPYARYGETVDSSLAEIEAARSAVEAGADRIQLLSLMRAGAARNAVDCALWDLEAKTARRGVASLIGASLGAWVLAARLGTGVPTAPPLHTDKGQKCPNGYGERAAHIGSRITYGGEKLKCPRFVGQLFL